MHPTANIYAHQVVTWTLNIVTLVVLSLRLYSRSIFTKSVGSDDFTACLSWFIGLANDAFNVEAIINGWGHHATKLSVGEYSSEQKWEYIGIITFYICLFFLRTSVTLFVLRLLPSYKKWHARFVIGFFFLNLAITIGGVVSVAVSCVPWKANWDAVPGKCYSKSGLVVTNQVNAALACVCDVVTALIPEMLLWNVRMRRKTKRILKSIFALGLVTASLSIARAAVNTNHALTEDVTYNQIAFYWVDMFEAKLGLIFACAPALRQFFSESGRQGTMLPSPRNRRPNADFEKMRIRINLRDILWYRKPHANKQGIVRDARPIFQSRYPPPGADHEDPEVAPKVKESVLDDWEGRAKEAVEEPARIASKVKRPASSSGWARLSPEAHPEKPRKASSPPTSKTRLKRNSSTEAGTADVAPKKPESAVLASAERPQPRRRGWSLFRRSWAPRNSAAEHLPSQFLVSDSRANAPARDREEPLSPIHDTAFAEELARPQATGNTQVSAAGIGTSSDERP